MVSRLVNSIFLVESSGDSSEVSEESPVDPGQLVQSSQQTEDFPGRLPLGPPASHAALRCRGRWVQGARAKEWGNKCAMVKNFGLTCFNMI